MKIPIGLFFVSISFFCLTLFAANVDATSKLFMCYVTFSTSECHFGDPPSVKLDMSQKSMQFVDSTDGFDSTSCLPSKSILQPLTVGCIRMGQIDPTHFGLKFDSIDDSLCKNPENFDCVYEDQMVKEKGMYHFEKTIAGIPGSCNIKIDDPNNHYLDVWKCSDSKSKTFYNFKTAYENKGKYFSGTHFNVLLSLTLLSTAFLVVLLTTIFCSWRRK